MTIPHIIDAILITLIAFELGFLASYHFMVKPVRARLLEAMEGWKRSIETMEKAMPTMEKAADILNQIKADADYKNTYKK